MRTHHRRPLGLAVSTLGLALVLLGVYAVPSGAAPNENANPNANGNNGNGNGDVVAVIDDTTGNPPSVECAGLTFLVKFAGFSAIGDSWSVDDNPAVGGTISMSFVVGSDQQWTWESLDGPDANSTPDALVTRIVLKAGDEDGEITYPDPGASSGTITWTSQHDMSHMTFCGPAPCVPSVDNNQCVPCEQGSTADGQGNCDVDCVPSVENNQCVPCEEGTIADGVGNCDVECVPSVENNQCVPCEQGTTADGQGGCDVDSCSLQTAACDQIPPVPPLTSDVPITAPAVLPAPAVAAAPAPVPAPLPEVLPEAVPAVAAAPQLPTEVAGVQQARTLPRTGSSIAMLAMVGGAFILLGGLSLYGSTLPAVRRVRDF